MFLFYSLGLWFYKLLIFIVSPFNAKAKLWRDGRKRIWKRIQQQIVGGEKIIWIHSSSLGEFEQGRPVIEAIKAKHPQYKIFLTFFSPSGYEIRKNYALADYVFYLPSDSPANARKLIKYVAPEMAIFIKYEFWYNYLNELNKNKIPTYIISAIFRENQLFFRWYGGWYKKMLFFFDHIFVQNQTSKNLLENIGIKNITITGDTRFDRVEALVSQSKKLELIEIFKQNKPVFIAGSSWQPDEEIIVNYINSTNRDIKFIIAPHEIGESNVQRLCSQIKKQTVRYSQIEKDKLVDAQVLIIDNIGMLSAIYKYGEIAYIGGGFGTGIHNILEAATYGMPVIFGPKHQKFQEATDLVAQKGAFAIRNQNDFNKIVDSLWDNPEIVTNAGNVCRNYVVQNLGATDKIMKIIFAD